MVATPYTVWEEQWTNVCPANVQAQTVEVRLVNSGPIWLRSNPQKPESSSTEGLPMVEPGVTEELVVPAGETLWARGINRNSRVEVRKIGEVQGPDLGLGWADYSDTQHPDQASAFPVPKNTDVLLPNNGAGGNRSQEPIPLFVDGRIRGNAGDGLNITTRFTFMSTGNEKKQFDFEAWFDIGIGSRLYPRYDRLRSASGGRPYLRTTGTYCLGFWEANGAAFYVRSTVDLVVWNIEHVIHRTFAAT